MESKTTIRKFKGAVKVLLLALPSLILIYQMFGPALKTTAGLIAFQLSHEEHIDFTSHKFTSRNIQKHFRKYDTSIDLDDIILSGQISRSRAIEYKFRGCLESNYVAYVPIKFHLPYYGVKVFEWCLQLKK